MGLFTIIFNPLFSCDLKVFFFITTLMVSLELKRDRNIFSKNVELTPILPILFTLSG